MPTQFLARGLFLAAIAIGFGLGALRYPIGDFTHAGPGLFPLVVSSFLLTIAILIIIQSRFVASVPLNINFKNIALVLLGLGSFVIFTKLLNMMVGIVLLVFIASSAGTSYSWKRNLKISAVLIVIALAFQKLLGLNLRLL